jgi:hypothetical protein
MFVFISCKKEHEPAEPFIDIQVPYENQAYTVGDSINVIAHIVSEEIITSVNVRLTDENLVPVQIAKNVFPGVHDYELKVSYSIYDKSLPSGKYYLLFQVFYANTVKNKYRAVILQELPLQLDAIYVLARSNVNTTTLYKVGSSGVPVSEFSFSSDHGFSLIDGMHSRLHLAGRNIGSLFSYDLDIQSVMWKKDFYNTPALPYFQGMYQRDGLIFVSSVAGDIFGYNSEGEPDYIAYTALPYYPAKLLAGPDFMLSNVLSKSSQESSLYHHVYPGGSLFYQYQIGFKVLDFWVQENGHVVVVGNEAGGVRICNYDPVHQLFTQKVFISGEKAVKSCLIEGNNLLLATETQLRYWINGSSTTSIVQSSNGLTDIQYEPKGGNIYLVNSLQYKVYNWPGMSYKQTVQLNDTIQHILFRYNK